MFVLVAGLFGYLAVWCCLFGWLLCFTVGLVDNSVAYDSCFIVDFVFGL